MAKFKIEGMKELEKAIKKLGKVPQKCVTPAAKKGMNIALKSARNNAPVDTGALRDGMKLIGEKASVKGKKVYRVVFDRAKNDIFQKEAAHTKQLRMYRGQGRSRKYIRYELKKYYYPFSQEFGFFARDGRYIPGYHFVSKGLNDNASAIEKKIVDEMGKQIDKVLEGK